MSTYTPLDPIGVQESATDPASARREPRRRLLVVAAIVVLALVAAGVAVVVSDRSAGEVRPLNAKVRDANVSAILKDRAAAVLAHDEKAWLADLDPEASSFADEQRLVFANLKQLDFDSWRYEVVNSEFSAPQLARHYGTPYILKPMLLHYAIKGYDLGPVARPEVLTFVERGDRWYLASDSDADADLPQTGHADPWDRRAMISREGRSVLVLADAQDRKRLDALVRVGDAAVARVAKMWPDGWRHKVVIIAVRDPRLIRTYFRTDAQNPDDYAAIAVADYDMVPGWTPEKSTLYDARADAAPRSRIILNPRYFSPYSSGNADLLTHEITHVATQAETQAGRPEWLVEGAAEYTAYRHAWPFTVTLPGSLAHQVAKGSVYLATYDFYQGDLAANYFAGFLACAYVADHYGEATLRRYYAELAETPLVTQTLDRSRRVTRRVLGLTMEQLQHKVAIYTASVE